MMPINEQWSDLSKRAKVVTVIAGAIAGVLSAGIAIDTVWTNIGLPKLVWDRDLNKLHDDIRHDLRQQARDLARLEVEARDRFIRNDRLTFNQLSARLKDLQDKSQEVPDWLPAQIQNITDSLHNNTTVKEAAEKLLNDGPW